MSNGKWRCQKSTDDILTDDEYGVGITCKNCGDNNYIYIKKGIKIKDIKPKVECPQCGVLQGEEDKPKCLICPVCGCEEFLDLDNPVVWKWQFMNDNKDIYFYEKKRFRGKLLAEYISPEIASSICRLCNGDLSLDQHMKE